MPKVGRTASFICSYFSKTKSKAVLNNPKSLALDVTTKYGVSNQSLNKEKIKDKVKKISKIIDELRELKNG